LPLSINIGNRNNRPKRDDRKDTYSLESFSWIDYKREAGFDES